MALTRRERAEKARKWERDKARLNVGSAEGVKVEVNSDFKCDNCGEAAGTLYLDGDKLLCYGDVPGDWLTRPGRMLSRAHSGRDAIAKQRRRMESI